MLGTPCMASLSASLDVGHTRPFPAIRLDRGQLPICIRSVFRGMERWCNK